MDDEGAFREFVAARIGAMSRVAYLLAGDHHGAEDLVQSSLVQLARHWRRISALQFPDAYVRRLIYNEHVSAWRRHRGAEIPVGRARQPRGLPDVADATERRLVWRQARARLTPRERAVHVLRYYK